MAELMEDRWAEGKPITKPSITDAACTASGRGCAASQVLSSLGCPAYTAHCGFAFFADVRCSCIFIYATCRLLVKKIKMARKPCVIQGPCGFCFLSTLSCLSHQLSPFPRAFLPPQALQPWPWNQQMEL